MTYRLLDSGNGEKLEMVGPHKVCRQAAQAFWEPVLDEAQWKQLDALHIRSKKGGGHWEFQRKLPESWDMEWGGLRFKAKLTPFGHIGLFPEQMSNWEWLRTAIPAAIGTEKVLNLFAYTGGSTLASSQAGAHVTHVDASKGVVNWARENAALNQLDQNPIRWIVDDVEKFIRREIRRESIYSGLILDPPTYGRGAKGETWKIEEDLLRLFKLLQEVAPEPKLILVSCHTPGFTGQVLAQMAGQVFGIDPGQFESGEMVTPTEQGLPLPSGFFARWAHN